MRIAVLHHPKSFFPLDVFQRMHEVAELVWVVDSDQWRDSDDGSGFAADDQTKNAVDPRFLRKLGAVVDVTGLEPAAATERLSVHRPDGVVSFVDQNIERAADLAMRLGLPFHSPQVAATVVNKHRQREALEREGLPSARFWPVPAGLGRAALIALAGEVSYPAVVKPVHGSGSLDIYRAAGPEELFRLLAPRVGRSPWLVEEYLPDSEDARGRWFANYLSVESVVSRGEVSHVAFCGRFPLADPFRETGNFIPAILEPGSERTLTQLVDDAVRALGIHDSVLHTEIKLTADGPRLVEVNGRLGGRPPFVLETVSPVNLFAVTAQVAAGVPVKFEHPVTTRGVGFWLMLHGPATARRVLEVRGLDQLAGLDGVDLVQTNRAPGSLLDARWGTDAHVLTVRGHTSDHAELVALVDTIRRTTVLTFEE